MTDRNINFSAKPEDIEAWTDYKLIKAYAKTKGISFSFLMIRAMAKIVKELKLK